ncbi:unnamed protein product [Rotaria sp. Silwood2]|nr:unnamed protein product [Rotaria sp. Silwood2]CAF4001242.1 unnamed protein product [Rotaria sp. Silwood2]CAF4298648.1 unnamed protein product [Rotaria sp. Silwood2]
MNLSNILDNNNNNTTFLITTLQSTRKSYVENPFNSWYIGARLMPNLYMTQSPPSSSTHSFVNRVVDPVLI